MTTSLTTRVILSGLILACLSACKAPVNTQTRAEPIERFWEPLLELCDKRDLTVVCPIPPFRQAINKAHAQWELASNCRIELKKCMDLEVVQKQDMQAQIFELKEKVSNNWQKILLWSGVSALIAFALGFGVHSL